MRRVIRSWPLKLVLTAGLLAVAFLQIDFADLRRGLAGAKPGLVALALVALVVARSCAAVRMHAIVRQHSAGLSLAAVIALNLKTAAAAFFLPGNVAGGVVRWQLLTYRGLGRADALTAIFFDRMSDFAALALTACIAAVLSSHPGTPRLAVLVMGIIFVAATLVQSTLVHPGCARQVSALLGRTGAQRWNWLQRTGARIAASASAYHALSWRSHAAIWGWSIASNVAGIAFYWALGAAVGLTLGAAEIGWVRGAVTALGLLPITFAGLGVREVAMIPLLAGYGTQPAIAVAFSLALFAAGALVAVTGSVLLAASFLDRGGVKA